jgi:hypothetical protein
MSQTLARRARIKDLSNKAEGVFQYVGNNNVLFRLISTGNELTSDVNLAVALFTDFARSHKLGSTQTRDTINAIYRRVGKLMCLIDIIHAAAAAYFARAECPEILMGANIDYEVGAGDAEEEGAAHA